MQPVYVANLSALFPALADMHFGLRLCEDHIAKSGPGEGMAERRDILTRRIRALEARIIESEARTPYEAQVQALIVAWTEGDDLSGYQQGGEAYAPLRAFCNGYYTVPAQQALQPALPF